MEAAAKERREAKAARRRRSWDNMVPLQIVKTSFFISHFILSLKSGRSLQGLEAAGG